MNPTEEELRQRQKQHDLFIKRLMGRKKREEARKVKANKRIKRDRLKNKRKRQNRKQL